MIGRRATNLAHALAAVALYRIGEPTIEGLSPADERRVKAALKRMAIFHAGHAGDYLDHLSDGVKILRSPGARPPDCEGQELLFDA